MFVFEVYNTNHGLIVTQSWPQSPKSQANNRKLSQHIVSVLETRTRTHLCVSVRIKSQSCIVLDLIRIGGLIVIILSDRN